MVAAPAKVALHVWHYHAMMEAKSLEMLAPSSAAWAMYCLAGYVWLRSWIHWR